MDWSNKGWEGGISKFSFEYLTYRKVRPKPANRTSNSKVSWDKIYRWYLALYAHEAAPPLATASRNVYRPRATSPHKLYPRGRWTGAA